MDKEQEPNLEERMGYWNTEFERVYGDLLTEAIIISYSGITEIGIENEKDIFYYKLKVLQALCDPIIAVESPSKELTYAFGAGLQEEEFEELREQLKHILKSDPTSATIINPSILDICDSVIANRETASFYFDFTPPKPKKIN